MKYYFILLDADNTLFDFDASEKAALTAAFSDLHISATPELLGAYHKINIAYWAMLAENKIEKKLLYSERFRELFARFSITGDPIAMQNSYRKHLNEQHILYDGAEFFLSALYPSYLLFLITNGDKLTQRRRLRDSGIDKYFADVFISDEIGYEKPDVGFFDYAASHIDNFSREKCLVVGDGLKTDIRGAINYGLDCVWFNPLSLPPEKGIAATHVSKSFDDIIDWLSRQ